MPSTSRVLSLATLVASVPVLSVTLLTWWAAGAQGGGQGSDPGVVTPGPDLLPIDDIKARIAGGADAIRLRQETVAALPVTDFFRPGFTTTPPTVPANPDSQDKSWDDLGSTLSKLNSSNAAFEVIQRHIGRGPINDLSEEQLLGFATELDTVAATVPTLKDWPERLREMAKDRKATKYFLDTLNSISRALDDRTKSDSDTLVHIADADLRKWNQQLADLKNPRPGTASMDSFPTIVTQHNEMKRRLDFWALWNPAAAAGTGTPTVAALESRRSALQKLQKNARDSAAGTPSQTEETEQIARIGQEIDRLGGEVLYLKLKDSIASKKSATRSIGDLLQQMQPIIESGAHRDDLIQDFRTVVEQELSVKKVRETKFPLYDFLLPPGNEIWLAYSNRKAGADGGLWISSYDLEQDDKVPFVTEEVYYHLTKKLDEKNGFLKVSEPTEVRIVNDYNAARNGLLGKLDQIDAWKMLQSQLTEQETELTEYYRRMKQFRKRAESGRHRLAPDLNFTADQKLISDVLANWSIVESLFRR